jgi:plastocyanin domain-containing protein
MTQDADGYHPSPLPTLTAGRPVRLIIDSKDSYSCASSFVIPGLGIERRLRPGENVIEFTPARTGAIPFSCSMGMYRGTLEVRP